MAAEVDSAASAAVPAPLADPADLTEVAAAAPADTPIASEPEDGPRAQDTPTGETGPVPETVGPLPVAEVVPPPPEPDAPPGDWDQPEAEAEAKVVPPPPEPDAPSGDGGRPEPEAEAAREAPWPEAIPAAARATPEHSPVAFAGEVSTPGIGGAESAERAPDQPTSEGLPPPGGPDPVPSEPPTPSHGLAAADAAEMLAPEPEPAREQAGEAPLSPGDAAPPAVALVEATQLPTRDPPRPELQEVGLSPPSGPADAPPFYPAVPAVTWSGPVETKPATSAPDTAARPLPALLPRPLPSREPARELPDLRPALPWVRLALRGAALAVAGLVVATLALVVLYRWVNPPVSTLMIGRSLAGTEIERTWVPLERISPHLMKAVLLSEDGAFCRHRGVDWSAIEEAIETDRGGSTITMQVVKNLFLWPSRSYVRKAIEIGLAYLVEALWPKRRILEIYLNIAEWGDGVFGVEAAAQAHFGKRAARLSAEEAALLAAVLPNPIERTAGAPSLITSRLASRLLVRMRSSRADLSCVPGLRTELRKVPSKTPQKAPLVQGSRMTL